MRQGLRGLCACTVVVVVDALLGIAVRRTYFGSLAFHRALANWDVRRRSEPGLVRREGKNCDGTVVGKQTASPDKPKI